MWTARDEGDAAMRKTIERVKIFGEPAHKAAMCVAREDGNCECALHCEREWRIRRTEGTNPLRNCTIVYLMITENKELHFVKKVMVG